MTADTTSRNTPDRMYLPVGREPFHPMLVPFAIACFAGAFVTDLVYWQTHETNLVARRLYDQVAERSGFIVYRRNIP